MNPTGFVLPLRPAGRPGRRCSQALRFAIVAITTLAIDGCSTLPSNTDRKPSTAYTDTDGTFLGRVASASRTAGSVDDVNVSGIELVARGEEAFGSLYTLIARAERSLDLQYYIVKDDPYARALLRAAREAAERGVRVRLLIDDFYTSGEDDRIAWYAAHPNIEVRLFNPFAFGRTWFATRLLSSLTDMDRINRRMHNKLFIVDNALAITGGRNVGSEYYQYSARTNFLDLDVLAAGPVVPALSDTFDSYWNSSLSYPIERLTRRGAVDAMTIDQKALADPNDPVRKATDDARASGAKLASELAAGRLPLVWSPTELVADQPTKIGRTAPHLGRGRLVGGRTIATDVLSLVDAAQHDLVVVSPYFVPGERGVRALVALVARGVHVRVLTNSLAATDAAIVHIGYSGYRKRLIEAGVEIYELRPDPGSDARPGVLGSSRASLHAKVLVIDRTALFVGSFNVDQRSALENTEMGLHIESAALADEVLGILRDRGAESRYRVTVDAHGNLLWTTRDHGAEQVFHDEPGAGTLLKWTLRLLAPFAPEQML